MKLLPLLSMGAKESHIQVKMVQLTMDKETKEYKLNVVGYIETSGNSLFAQVYDSYIQMWSVVESRERRNIRWDYSSHLLYSNCPFMYNCADRNLQYFKLSNIAPRLTV